MIDYKEAKKKISIISILRDWGYKFDKSKGKISPNFVLRDEHGKEIDRVIITNPKKSEEQGYWRRDGGKGDLYYVHQGEPEPVWCGRTQRDGHSDKGLGEVDEH